MGSTITVTATNAGPTPAYNATVGSTDDSFVSVPSTAVLSKTAATIGPGSNVTLSYAVTMLDVTGTQTGTLATASFYFGGTPFTFSSSAPKAVALKPLSVSITTTPSAPEEGKSFTISIVVTNPTDVPVSGVLFTLPVPSGLGLSDLVNAQVSSGLLTVSTDSLGPHGNITASARAVAGSGITIPFQSAKLTFTYAGSSLSGTVPKATGIAISEDVLTRYIIPTGFVLLATLAAAFYIRRKAVSAPASPK